MKRVVTFGEIMLRLQPYNYERFVQCDHVEFTFGGGEANVAVSLANYGLDAAYLTKLPTHEIGQSAVNTLRRFGVDTSLIIRGGERVGIYFVEKGASQRPSKVIYDRANSSIATAKKEDFDWAKIFDGVEWFHFTGITPAISDSAAEITLEALKEAKNKCKPVLLEPVMKVEVVIPDEYLGDVMGDITSRRGRLDGMEARGNAQVIRAYVPLSEMFGYATDLRSKTQGRGQYVMEPDGYKEVPKSISESIISERSKRD